MNDGYSCILTVPSFSTDEVPHSIWLQFRVILGQLRVLNPFTLNWMKTIPTQSLLA